MANFQKASGVGGTGFDESAYSMLLRVDHRRSVALFGGGPNGEALTVGVADPTKLRIVEHLKTRDDQTFGPSIREFWLDGAAVGLTALFAKLPDGREYTPRLPVVVTNSNDKRIMLDAPGKPRIPRDCPPKCRKSGPEACPLLAASGSE